jgi:hypothetical protein
MFRRIAIAFLAAAITVPIAVAQRGGGLGRSSIGRSSFAHGSFYRGQRGFYGAGLLGSPFLYSGYDIEPYAVEAPTPQVVIMQPPSDSAPRSPKPAPLLIEWRGDRYVRYGGNSQADNHETVVHPDYAESGAAKASANPPVATPAVLVYRDGHRDEISDYAIADGVIYVQGTYWQNGSRPKPIPLSALDSAATMQANRDRGAKFILPSASNVVIASF